MTLLAELASDYRTHGRSLRNTAFWAVGTYHFGLWSKAQTFVPLRVVTDAFYACMALWVEMVSGITLHRESIIGANLHLVHSGNIKIDAGVRIGKRVGIMHNVTIAAADDKPGLPVIGDGVYIGTGATILGPVTIGQGARIASNSLVLEDVPADTTAVGVPARVLRYTGRPSSVPPPQSAQSRAEAVDA